MACFSEISPWIGAAGCQEVRGEGMTTKPYAVGLAAAATIAVAGCTGDARPVVTSSATSPAPSSSSTSGSTTTSGTSTAPSTTTAGTSPAIDADVPEAAKSQTVSGAEAFTTYFIHLINRAMNSADPDLIPRLALPSCTSCASYNKTVQQMHDDGQHMQGGFLTLSSVTASTFSKEVAEVLVTARQGGEIVDSSGGVVSKPPAKSGRLSVSLTYNSGWRVSLVQVVTA